MITVFNPRILLWSYDGKPSPKSIIKFFEAGTDVPKSVKYVEGGTLTQEIIADSSGEFPQVELLYGEYTLKGFTPIDPKNPYPLYPEDYELRSTWDLSGASTISGSDVETVETLADLAALRAYSGDATEVWVGNRVYIKDAYVSQVDNNGTIIVSAALEGVVWRMDLTGYDMTSLDWFGADRTGANDSTAAILTAISAIYSNDANSAPYKLPRTLYIPEGVYMINSDINFTCPVFMEKSVRFGNRSALPVTMTFSAGLETTKVNAFDLGLPGLSPIHLKFPNGGDVRLGWFNNSEINMDDHGSKINVIGPGKITVSGGNTRRIGKLETNGIVEFSGAAGSKIYVDNIISGGSNIKISGSATFRLYSYSDFRLSWLDDKSMLNRVNGQKLIIDEDWDIDFNVDTTWGIVEGENWPSVVNTSGTLHTAMFYLADVLWKTMSCSVHDITWLNKSKPNDMDWTGADSDDWNNYLIYGENDFSGTNTSGDINLTSDVTLRNLNHTGTMWAFGHSLVLDSCTIHLSYGKQVRATALTINDSNILTDDPANGQITSPNMRLRDSFVQCEVAMANGENLQLEMRGCRFANQVSVESIRTLQTLVAKNNEVALAEFIPYVIYCSGLSTAAGLSFDVSDNWTTDLSGQLVRTKGFAITTPSYESTSHFYYQTFESLGILDIRERSSSRSFAKDARIYPYWVSGRDDDFVSLVTPLTGEVGCVQYVGYGNFNHKNMTFDAWNTQNYGV